LAVLRRSWINLDLIWSFSLNAAMQKMEV
jgi:hypothetical protein